jgi:Chaperone of endosialidase
VFAGFNLTAGDNNIYLRNAGVATESNTIRIGNPAHTHTFLAGVRGTTTGAANAVAVVIDSNGQLGTISSSERFKKDIKDMDESSHKLLELRPVTYHYKQASEDGSNPLEYGLIAEEVAKVYPDLVAYGADGKIETVQYHKLTPMLLNEVKHLNASLQMEKDKNLAQAEEIAGLKQQTQEIAFLKQQMAVLQTQAQNIQALTSRLSRIEAKDALGMAEKVAAKGRNPG